MSDYIDAILHVSDLPALALLVAQVNPDMVSEAGTISGFASTPATMNGVAALVYVRMTPAEAAQWRGTPFVTILAEAPYGGPSTPDAVYEGLATTPASMALYNAVYPRTPQAWTDDDGQHEYTPPFRFGAMG